jgi:hypothetical protein
MKLLMIIYSGSDRRLVPTLLDRHEAGGWTELTQVYGAGATGRREGTRAWPGNAAIFLSIVPADRAGELTTALQSQVASLAEGERLHVAVLPIETFF